MIKDLRIWERCRLSEVELGLEDNSRRSLSRRPTTDRAVLVWRLVDWLCASGAAEGVEAGASASSS